MGKATIIIIILLLVLTGFTYLIYKDGINITIKHEVTVELDDSLNGAWTIDIPELVKLRELNLLDTFKYNQ